MAKIIEIVKKYPRKIKSIPHIFKFYIYTARINIRTNILRGEGIMNEKKVKMGKNEIEEEITEYIVKYVKKLNKAKLKKLLDYLNYLIVN